MSQIIIHGQVVTAAKLVNIVGSIKTQAEIYSQALKDFNQESDELTRAYRVAICLSGGCVVAIASLAMSQSQVDETGQASGLAAELAGIVFTQHLAHHTAWGDCKDGKPPALPTDMATRKAALAGALAALQSSVASSTIKVDALTDGPIKVDAKALLETIAAIVKGAGESLQFAENTYSIAVTKADADQAVANAMAQLLAAGKTAAEAQTIIDGAVGATDAERIAYIKTQSEAPLCLGSEGTMNGGTLSTEQEIAIGVEAVKRLDALIV
ncbi:hypothetical protein KBI23_20740 [bacterium]|nr:hypothetical protein [bacterium]